MSSETIEVANTIRQQIMAGRMMDGRNGTVGLMCWAARRFTALQETDKRLGGLLFLVSGAKFTGRVQIELMGNDTYTVSLIRVRNGSNNVIQSTENVYCEDLASLIDGLVESGGNPHYVDEVNLFTARI